jgi:hypothetical protein
LVQESLAATMKQVWSQFVPPADPDVCSEETVELEIDQEIHSLARNRVETAIIMDRAEMDL